ncbi:MAG: hypothetical protein JWM28_4541 [Chitinophagaceae bacterium]|nr:hypothetical protein [Chitinophagaceae bacterium]
MLIMSVAFLGCSGGGSACAEFPCQNGGFFENCECSCPEGFSGVDCSTKITPTKMFINKIVLKQFPATNAGSYWDNNEDTSGHNPDVFFELVNTQGAVYTDYQTDVSGQTTILIPNQFTLTNITGEYLLSAYDYDGGEIVNSDLIASQYFHIYNSAASSGFPSIITVTNAAESFSADVYVTYQW